MKYDAYAQLFREKAVGQNDTVAVPTATITLYTNAAKAIVARAIVNRVNSTVDYFSMTQLADLVADQREYPFPDDILKNTKIVEAYIGSEWRRLYPMDLSSYRLSGSGGDKPWTGESPEENFSGATTDTDTIEDNFSDTYPKYDSDGRSIVIYSESVDTVTGGLKLRGSIMPKDYIDADWATTVEMQVRPDTLTAAMPVQSHDIMLMKAVIDYKEIKGIPLTQFELTYNQQLADMLTSLSDTNEDESIEATVERDTNNY